ncbi:MAG: hypothetical protein WAM66_05585 [Acidobacteriaceae bacterium]
MCEPQSPVVPGLEPYEIVYANNQPQYAPLAVLRSPAGVTLSRWALSQEERTAIAAGADLYLSVQLYLSVHTGFQPLQPISIQVARAPDPEQVEHDWELKRELDMRVASAK